MLAASLLRTSGEAQSNFVDLEIRPWEWAAVLGFISVLLLFDILVLHREAHVPSFRRAAIESAAWISVGLSFGLVVWVGFSAQAAGEYYAGFLIEKSLSVDNVFVWALIFTHFRTPRAYQHRVLFWGIFGALVLRAIFIFAGVALIERFSWILFVFGAFLLFTAFRLVTGEDHEVDPDSSRVIKVLKKVIPSSDAYDGQRLFSRLFNKRVATPLFFVLVLIETSDVIFAVDSIPAVLAVSQEEYIVFTSNAFAILGLRALYFLLADMHERFTYLNEGLAVILAFVGLKMIAAEWYHVPTVLSLLFIGAVLAVAILLSWRKGAQLEAANALAPYDSSELNPPPDDNNRAG